MTIGQYYIMQSLTVIQIKCHLWKIFFQINRLTNSKFHYLGRDLIDFLIKSGVNINAVDKNGNTALNRAATLGITLEL